MSFRRGFEEFSLANAFQNKANFSLNQFPGPQFPHEIRIIKPPLQGCFQAFSQLGKAKVEQGRKYCWCNYQDKFVNIFFHKFWKQEGILTISFDRQSSRIKWLDHSQEVTKW